MSASSPMVGSQSYSYCHDFADRLTSTTDTSVGALAYDAHGNVATMGGETHVYDVADRHVATKASSKSVLLVVVSTSC